MPSTGARVRAFQVVLPICSRPGNCYDSEREQPLLQRPIVLNMMTRTTSIIALAFTAAVAFASAALAAPQPGVSSPLVAGASGAEAKRADFRSEKAAPGVQEIADWAVRSRDHRGLPFIVVDKLNAKAYAFDRAGVLLKSTPVLLGMGVGDKLPPGVAEMDMYKTQPWQRVTPAGRFFAEEDKNLAGETVLWVDYDSGIALHRMPARKTKQRRHERMVSADPVEHRITYGCINVPAAYYDRIVHPQFRTQGGMVYVLPDSTPLKAVFKALDEPGRTAAAVQHTSRLIPPAQPQKF